MMNGGSGHRVEYMPVVYPAPLNPQISPAYSKLSAGAFTSCGLMVCVVPDCVMQPTSIHSYTPDQWEQRNINLPHPRIYALGQLMKQASALTRERGHASSRIVNREP